jgi:Na+/phosphate symporter
MAMDVQELPNHMTPDEIDEFDNLANCRREFKQCVSHWTEYHVKLAIRDGRITRVQAGQLYLELIDKLTEVCMDSIPAPEE